MNILRVLPLLIAVFAALFGFCIGTQRFISAIAMLIVTVWSTGLLRATLDQLEMRISFLSQYRERPGQ